MNVAAALTFARYVGPPELTEGLTTTPATSRDQLESNDNSNEIEEAIERATLDCPPVDQFRQDCLGGGMGEHDADLQSSLRNREAIANERRVLDRHRRSQPRR